MSHNSYIVVFKDDSSKEDYERHAEEIKKAGGSVDKHFGDVIKGFSAKIPEEHKAKIEKDPAVEYIEPDGEMKTQS